MSQKGNTPDEKFLIQLYRTAMQKGNPFKEIDSRSIGKALGQKETAVKNIVKHLAQANFVKKVNDTIIHLTQHGCNFVLDELESE